jgi:hypothetical protein
MPTLSANNFFCGNFLAVFSTASKFALNSVENFVYVIQYTVKKIIDFSVPSRDVTNQTLPSREKFKYSPPGIIWLVKSRLGKIANLFLLCISTFCKL